MRKVNKVQQKVKCPDCGHLCKTGGLVNHIRLKHKNIYNTVNIPTKSQLVAEKGLVVPSEKLSSNSSKQIEKLSKQVEILSKKLSWMDDPNFMFNPDWIAERKARHQLQEQLRQQGKSTDLPPVDPNNPNSLFANDQYFKQHPEKVL